MTANPLHWTREHKIVWFGISAIGAVAGILLAYIESPLFSLTQNNGSLTRWLLSPGLYWRWAVYGFLITAAAFYAAQLFRSSN
ncbi:MAG TPA: hypothetical protein VGL83_17290 [Stellaceae bacterium]|jgi:hypothetical protein